MRMAERGAGRKLAAVVVILLQSHYAAAIGRDPQSETPNLSTASDKATAASLHLRVRKLAAVIFPQNACAELVRKNAQARFESILADNEVTVLDEKKAAELKDVCKGLNDPSTFITPETFLANAEKFDIQAIAAIYIHADVTPGLADYFSAAAQAAVRVVDNKDAGVAAFTTMPMGIPGAVPSDGLTTNSALVNAVYRAVDDACEKMHLRVTDKTRPRTIRVTIEGPVSFSDSSPIRKPENDPALIKMAKFEAAKWRSEEATCTAKSPDGSLAAVAGYIKDTDMHRNPARLFGSRVHLIDVKTQRTLYALECSPVEKKTKAEPGTKQVLDCMFVSNWRYVAAVNGSRVFFWDTETGQSLSAVSLPQEAESAALGFVRSDGVSYLTVQTNRGRLAYRIVSER